jgi:glycerol kinase
MVFGPWAPWWEPWTRGPASPGYVSSLQILHSWSLFHQVQVELYFPNKGWVEQDPQELLDSSITFINSTMDKLKKLSVDPTDIVSIGVTYQGETVVVWVGEVVAW